ncbi:MAG: pilus assembly PilX N-terminal domain-containing protein [Syntrophomonadaceae bacterium]|jgi:hypothetical protein|nr:pilus assembly PilX N-terminal domain-containing protein [Syntrophomonadaceae bacterium]
MKRSDKYKGIADENGQIIVLALVIFLLLTLIEGAVLSISFTERKMSKNDVRLKQAQLAADSGLEWAAGAVYNHLLTYGNLDLLPSYDGKKIVLDEQVSFELKGGAAELSASDNYLVYSISSVGICDQAKREVTAKIRYDFEEMSGEEGSETEYSKGYIIFYELAGHY